MQNESWLYLHVLPFASVLPMTGQKKTRNVPWELTALYSRNGLEAKADFKRSKFNLTLEEKVSLYHKLTQLGNFQDTIKNTFQYLLL